MHTYTLTVNGTTYTATSTGYAECRECIGRIYAYTRPTGDGMTAADWQQAQTAAAERAQRADDAATYNTQDRPDSWGVGY